MKPKFKDRLDAEIAATDFFNTLPAQIRGFTLTKILAEDGDKFNYFAYENGRRSLTAYFHEGTEEYKVRAKIGLSEFCLTDFFTGDFTRFTVNLAASLDTALAKLTAPADDLLLAEKNLAAWNYAKTLPKNLEGFELFIAPAAPAKFTNGSYIVINYADFTAASDLTIFYNAYTDDFTGETRIRLVPHVSYLFDAATLKDLETALAKNLAAELAKIKKFTAP